MNETDEAKETNETDYGLREMNKMDYGLKQMRWDKNSEVVNVYNKSGGEVDRCWTNMVNMEWYA